MAFRPSSNLRSPTFVGLLVAQFFAAFNDQAIHASAMFFAFHMRLLNEKQAISLMPILFYAPWAIFCTLAGYFADRYSKRQSLVFWKFAEIAICAVALAGFYLGDMHNQASGPILVLACVFLMGMHSAFFVPAKYGVMPEILEPQILSRGNGLLESLSFLAVILGTVCGGMLSFWFKGRETWIGVVLLALAVIGALASLLIAKMPAANPTRRFPPYLYAPLKQSLTTLLGSRPLALAVVGIAFFTFVVAYMRQAVYMLGESQTPRWDEWETSLIVGSTALGIGLGSPLAGFLSGRKIELGLVPLGGLGMVIAAVLATFSLHWVPGLVAAIVAIGFFTGFYLVPLYTLLQHRAPKSSKGDAVAISNFINVTGAILASILFYLLVSGFQSMGYARPIRFDSGRVGRLVMIKYHEGRLDGYELAGLDKPVNGERGIVIVTGPKSELPPTATPENAVTVVEHRASYRGRNYYYLRAENEAFEPVYDNSGLPGFLFLGAAVITALILLGLYLIMPDLPRRAAWAFRNLGRVRVRAVGTHHVPLNGAALLATNCRTAADCNNLRSATDRLVTFVGPLSDSPPPANDAALADRQLNRGRVVALTDGAAMAMAAMSYAGPVIPVFVGPSDGKTNELRVSFGAKLSGRPDAEHLADAIRAAAVAEEDYHGH